ncbi:polyketide synthase dehydratase domain-containing protein, partial [Streptomyces sp. NRRL S-1831]|uniref:polyketide synthase dehydratase domain-containing protein n=1 Tax=Streptomyces sp. NRRL S-1831 TaxID=1463890 RepID=UPI00131A890F
EGMYEDLAAEGLSYGPAFQGVRAAWRRGEETFAEIGTEALGRDLNRFTLHPALLDAALHTLALQDGVGIRLPFTWSGVELYEGGTGADTGGVVGGAVVGGGVGVRGGVGCGWVVRCGVGEGGGGDS